MICPAFAEPWFLIYVPTLSSLIYYSHLPAIIVALGLCILILSSDGRSLINRLLAGLCFAFAVWTTASLVAWTNIHSDVLLFAWSFLGPAAGFISILSVYFTYVFLYERDAPTVMKVAFAALIAPLVLLSSTAATLSGINLVDCDAFGFEGFMNTTYFPALGALAIGWNLILLLRRYRSASKAFRKQTALMGTGIQLFLFSFFTTVFLGQYLATIGVLPDSQIETYGYFGMIVFAVYLSVLIVRFQAFHVALLASQALVAGLILLTAAQLFFVNSGYPQVLAGITVALTAVAGAFLIQSVKREIAQRERIEALAGELEKANGQQAALIRFITHQLKGFMSKARGIFSMLQEGDFGALPDAIRPIVAEGFQSTTKGAQTIQEILNASNIKSGAVVYAKQSVSLGALVNDVAAALAPNATARGLELIVCVPESLPEVVGDQMQLENAVRNLIDNSIKYTLTGTVRVSVASHGACIKLTVSDTGVGITSEDMARLFTEGGHGKEAHKVNVDSTGFGLYIVKNIVEAHGGTVRAESDGPGKGATFTVELPTSPSSESAQAA